MLQEVVDSVSYTTGSCKLLVLFIVIATHLVVEVVRCPLGASGCLSDLGLPELVGGGEGRTNGHWDLADRSIQAEPLLHP